MEIELCGYNVLIDNEDYEALKLYKWHISMGAKNYVKTYIYDNCKRKALYLHRLVMKISNKNYEIDHINGNTLDCRKENLRICTHSLNMKNRGKQKNNTTGYKGVYKRGNKYFSSISVNNKRIWLGMFNTINEAKNAYKEASKKYHGEFGRTE